MDPLTLLVLIIDNQDAILDVVYKVIAGASVVAAMTPTNKVDGFLAKLLNLAAINVGGAKPKESKGIILGVIKLLGRKK